MIEVLNRLFSEDAVRCCRQEEVINEAPWAEVLIPSMCRITSQVIHAALDLKLIQQFGVGLEGVDIRAAAARGIPVANVPGNQASNDSPDLGAKACLKPDPGALGPKVRKFPSVRKH